MFKLIFFKTIFYDTWQFCLPTILHFKYDYHFKLNLLESSLSKSMIQYTIFEIIIRNNK